ncbi:MAG TPA: APC family permease [Acidimicrobiales bacterium]|nr:APC family permease [Acidimicrobiales bacterium]
MSDAPPSGAAEPAVAADAAGTRSLSTRQAAFIGVGSMVGAGIFSLLGAAGEVAGAAVWVSFLIAGAIAGLQGYSFAKLGSRYPSAGGLMEYVGQIFGRDAHLTGIVAWLLYAANAVVTAMVAVSFGSYASSAFADGSETALKAFAVVVIVAMTALNAVGSQAVARAQTIVVVVVIGILLVFSVTTLSTVEPDLLAPSDYPSLTDIVSSVALTFFAFLGFGVITFTAGEMREPKRQLPRAMYLALGIATGIYVLVSIGVFGTLTVQEVIDSGGTALAVAAEPVLGRAGYWLMSVTALFATAGATNAGLFPATGLGRHMVEGGQWPPVMARRAAGRAPWALVLTSVAAAVLAVLFDLTAIASIGSAVALSVFALISGGHLRVRGRTGASAPVLLLAVSTCVIVLATFAATTLTEEPGTLVAIAVILLVSLVIDIGWKRRRDAAAPAGPAAPAA